MYIDAPVIERVAAVGQQDVAVLIELWQSGWVWYRPWITAFVLQRQQKKIKDHHPGDEV